MMERPHEREGEGKGLQGGTRETSAELVMFYSLRNRERFEQM